MRYHIGLHRNAAREGYRRGDLSILIEVNLDLDIAFSTLTLKSIRPVKN